MRILFIARRMALTVGLSGLLAIALYVVPAQSQSAGTAEAAPAVRIVELISQPFPVGQASVALAAPVAGATSVMRLRAGAVVQVVGIVEGDAWYQIELPDKRLAYVPVDAIPAAASPPPASSGPPVSQSAESPLQQSRAPEPAQPAPVQQSTKNPPQQQDMASDSDTIGLPPTIEFEAANDQLSVIRLTPLFLGPNEAAPQAYPVVAGTMVQVIAKSKDGAWAWVATADGKPAYLMMSDLGPSQ
jgi:hypothetical protein